jgi:hypothetical protein
LLASTENDVSSTPDARSTRARFLRATPFTVVKLPPRYSWLPTTASASTTPSVSAMNAATGWPSASVTAARCWRGSDATPLSIPVNSPPT